MKATLSFLLLVLNIAAIQLCHAQTVKAVTGYEIPIEDLKLRFPKADKSNIKEIEKNIYHITSGHVIRGYGRTINLKNETTRQFPVPIPPKAAGKASPSTMRQGARYGYTFTNRDGNILNAWGPNLNLMPLDRKKHPEILIHSEYDALSSSHGTVGIQASDETKSVYSLESVERNSEVIEHALEEVVSSRQEVVPPGTTCADRLPSRIVEVVAAFDHTFCAMYGGNAADATSSIFGAFARANVPFALQTCLRLDLVDTIGTCDQSSDPYRDYANFASPGEILSNFRTYWNTEMSGVQRDLAVLVTGFDDGTKAHGESYVRSTCNEFSYARVEGAHASFLAHQIGYMLGASEKEGATSGIMMMDVTESSELVFSSESVREIIEYVDRDIGGRSACFAIGTAPRAMPSMTPTPSSLPMRMTCANKFSPGQAVSCIRRYKFAHEIETLAGWVDLEVKQSGGNVTLRVNIEASADKTVSGKKKYYRRRLVEYRRMVSAVFDARDAGSDLGGRLVSNTASRWITNWPMNTIRSSDQSCCGNDLYFYVEVVAELWVFDYDSSTWSFEGNQRVRDRFTRPLECLQCAAGETLFPPSENRECPQCAL